MKTENINYEKLKEVEKRLGCTFCDDGIFAEMGLDLAAYEEKTHPIANVEYKFFQGDVKDIKRAVALVDEDWVQYFDNHMSIFCGYLEGQIASFCNVDTNTDCMISAPRIKVGAIGCVGTVPQYRNLGIGLRMVDLATLYLKNKGCDKSYIHYTHIDKWYEKLGYRTFARFSFKENKTHEKKQKTDNCMYLHFIIRNSSIYIYFRQSALQEFGSIGNRVSHSAFDTAG